MQKGNVAVIVIIVLILLITVGVTSWLFVEKTQTSVRQPVAAQPTKSVMKNQPSTVDLKKQNLTNQQVETVAINPSIESVETSIDEKVCQTINMESDGEMVIQHCPGIADFILQADYADARESVTIISPEKKEYPLSFWGTVGYGFSHLGKTVEWRLATGNDNKKYPIAILIPFSVSDVDPTTGIQDPYKDYMVIAKITSTEVCVTDVLDLSDKNNMRQEFQRQVADTAVARACKKISQ